jgi:hypothetical protein
MRIIEKNIIKIIAEVSNVPVEKIIRNKRATRQANVVISRQLLVNLLFRNFNYTNHMVKDVIGYKNHASVVHARNMHDTDYQYDSSYRRMYDKAMDMLGLYINDKDEQTDLNLTMRDKIQEQNKELDRYKNLWMKEKSEKERAQEMLITFKKKYIPR